MNFDLVLLLPLIAIALAVFFPLFRMNPKASRSIKSRRHRKIMLGRLTVFMLPIATLIILASPLPDLEGHGEPSKYYNLVKALAICAAVLIPASLAHLYMTLRYGNNRNSDSSSEPMESENIADFGERPVTAEASDEINQVQDEINQVQPVLLYEQTSSVTAKAEALPAIDLTAASFSTGVLSETQPATPSLLIRKHTSTKSTAHATEDGIDSPAEVQEQLDRVAEFVDSHDLGNSDYSLSEEDLAQKRFPMNSDVPLSIESALTTVEKSSSELSKMSSNEISELVTTLRTDKTRLQKLVISQQASIDSERKAHDQSRVVARDAIKIMRDARNGQKFAEKLARRERSERKRLEQQYNKVSHALDNAMSIIESRKVEDAEA